VPVTFVSTGALRSRVTLLKPTGTTGPTGGVIPGEPEVLAADVPAAIASSPANEQLRAGAQQSLVTHVVRLRYLPGVVPFMVVAWEGLTFQILSIVDVAALHVELELRCAEVQ